MYEEKVKKRGWIKNVAIVFLSILLVLTFFSNTIMNRSLPEVSAQYVSAGTINAKIRGSGTVTANQSYDVVLKQTREVEQVCIKVGDKVEVGDVLFVLAESDSTELTEAETSLETMQLDYQKALINMTDTDYAKENRDIARAQEKLNESIAERDANAFVQQDLDDAKQYLKIAKEEQRELEDNIASLEAQLSDYSDSYSEAVSDRDSYKAEITSLEADIKSYQEQLDNLGSGESTAELERKIKDLEAELAAANQVLAEDQQIYGADYQALRDAAIAALAPEDQGNEEKIKIQMGVLVKTSASDEQKTAYETLTKDQDTIKDLQTQLDRAKEDLKFAQGGGSIEDQKDALEKKLKAAKSDLSTAESNLSKAERRVKTYNSNVNGTKSTLTIRQSRLKEQQALVEDWQTQVTDLETQKTEYDALVDAVETNQTALEDLVYALQDTQEEDKKTIALAQLDLQAQRNAIARQQEKVEELKADAVGKEVTSNVAGTVSTISATAGNSAAAGEPMAQIVVEDRGYILSIPVTLEQSKKVAVGDVAEITNYYWGSDIQATLSSIKSDPSNPGGKLLEFNITGEVDAGTNLTLAIGQKSQSYDTLVPRSAVRTDSNGDFVLVITAKNTPLGNRYIATRVDVKVLATDDTLAAVSGLNSSDFVITNSSKPIESGMQVRIADN
jgi:chromosome segregation ATPase